MARILSISYDERLLQTREALLRYAGYEVVSAGEFRRALHLCDLHNAGFNLIVLGHSIPHDDKTEMVRFCKESCCCPIVALLRLGEPPVEGADRSIDPDPVTVLTTVSEVLATRPEHTGRA